MDDMTGRFGIGTMHAVFEVVGTVFAEKHALNIMGGKKIEKNKCLRYSWCNIIWASGFVGFYVA